MSRRLPFHSNAAWPPLVLLFIFAAAYLCVNIPLWLVERSAVRAGRILRFEDAPEFYTIRAVVFIGAAVVFALVRLWRFHPACNPAYSTWLRLSPWTPAKPLPLGPVHLVWQDAAVAGLLAWLTWWQAHSNPLGPVVAFGLVYFGGFTLLLAAVHRWAHCVALGFLWPALMLPWVQGWEQGTATVAIVIAIMVVIWHGHRQSLRAFPWEFLNGTNGFLGANLQTDIQIRCSGMEINNPSLPSANNPGSVQMGGLSLRLGWPYLALAPKIKPSSVSVATNLALSSLLGWWSFCIITASAMDPEPGLIALAAVMAAGLRLVIYCSGNAPPVNWPGRLVSGRIIFPGYDQVFLTPLAGLATATLGLLVVKHSGVWFPAAEAITIAATWLVLFGGGPTLRNWLLTGQHRLRPPAQMSANKRIIRPV